MPKKEPFYSREFRNRLVSVVANLLLDNGYGTGYNHCHTRRCSHPIPENHAALALSLGRSVCSVRVADLLRNMHYIIFEEIPGH